MKDRIIDSIGKIDDDMIESVDALRQSPKKRPQKNNHIMVCRRTYSMKIKHIRKICAVLIIGTLASGIIFAVKSGCSEKTLIKYSTVISDISDSISGVEMDTTFWTMQPENDQCDKEKECNIPGYSIKGHYTNSMIALYNSYITDYYVEKNVGEFGVRRDDGQIVEFAPVSGGYLDSERRLDDVENCEEYCFEYAKEIAVEFLGSLDGYETYNRKPTEDVEEIDGKLYSVTFYSWSFYKNVSGYRSTDYITVSVSSKGHLMSVTVGDTGAFDGKAFEIDGNQVEQSVKSKVLDVYKKTDYSVNNMEIGEQIVVKAPDGHYYLKSDVTVSLSSGSKDFYTSLALMTYLGQ